MNTVRSEDDLLIAFADNTTQQITPQDMRDLIVTTFHLDSEQGDVISDLSETVEDNTSDISSLNSTVSSLNETVSDLDETVSGLSTNDLDSSTFKGWSVISNRPLHTTTVINSVYSITTRLELVPPFDVDQIALVYDNIKFQTISGETVPQNPIIVSATLQPIQADLTTLGTAINDNPATLCIELPFPEGRRASILGGTFAVTNPLMWRLLGNKRSFIKTYVTAMNGIPAAPTAAASSGSGLNSGNWFVCYTVCYPGNYESVGSTASSQVTTSSGTAQITVTSPSASSFPGAIGYRVWMTAINTANTADYFISPSGIVPFGTNYIITQAASVGTLAYPIQRVNAGVAPYLPYAGRTIGGTTAGASNNGEFSSTNVDRSQTGTSTNTNANTNPYGPVLVLGLDPIEVHPSLAICGDSIAAGGHDQGFAGGALGGWAQRICLNHQSTRYYDPTIAPYCGHTNLANASENGSTFAGNNGVLRSKLAAFCTTVLLEYGTNDFNGDVTSPALLISYTLTSASRFSKLKRPRRVLITTILPFTNSSDGWSSYTNQSWPASQQSAPVTFEPNRRQYNNFLRSTVTTGQSVTDENMMGSYASVAYNGNWQNGGDGVATKFMTQLPFVAGSETITVNGITQVLTTDYTYYNNTASINGTSYASGVVFVTAPSAGHAVRASYTSIPGMATVMGDNVVLWDVAAAVEVNTSGVLTPNGGLWQINTDAPLLTGSATNTNTSTTFNDNTQSWTQDQWRNYVVYIVSDSSTPAAAGQQQCISSNSATQLSVSPGWSTTPSSSATYKIIDPYVTDGRHPAPKGHMTIAQALNEEDII